MPRHVWSVLCQQVITDRETNTTSYITCLDSFGLREFPEPFPSVFLGSLWKRSEEGDAIEMRVRVFSPDGDVLLTRAHPRKEFGDFQRYRINLRLGGFDITAPGDYEFVVEHRHDIGWEEDVRIPVTVSQVE